MAQGVRVAGRRDILRIRRTRHVRAGARGVALIVAGLSHHMAPIEVREQVAIAAHETPRVLEELARTTGASELALLSTCNRTELYVVEGDAAATPGIWAHLSHRFGGGTVSASYDYVRRDREAAEHLY